MFLCYEIGSQNCKFGILQKKKKNSAMCGKIITNKRCLKTMPNSDGDFNWMKTRSYFFKFVRFGFKKCVDVIGKWDL